jgi:hypothetical protein
MRNLCSTYFRYPELELLGFSGYRADFHEGYGPAQYSLSSALFVNWHDMTVSVQSKHRVSPALYMCVRDATLSQSSPAYVRARRDTLSVQHMCVPDTTQSQSIPCISAWATRHSLSPVLYVCELAFNFPSSKESRLTEQAISKLVTIYKPHEHITHVLFIYSLYIHIYVCEYYKISA